MKYLVTVAICSFTVEAESEDEAEAAAWEISEGFSRSDGFCLIDLAEGDSEPDLIVRDDGTIGGPFGNDE